MAHISLKFCVYVIIFFVIVVNAQWAIEDDGCRTPDRGIGSCVVINKCKPVTDLLESVSQPIPPKISNLLKRYHCGFERNQPKVCCPPGPINVPGLSNQKPTNNVPQPPIVSSHRNINLLPKTCGHMDTTDRIVYGNKTGLFEFPWMVLLSYRTQRGADFKCGGTIINNRYILTAAHCITELRYSLIGVRVGDHDISTRVDCEENDEGEQICAPAFQDLSIEEIIPHPEYNSKAHLNDIGLLRVAPINLNLENMKPVCLPLEKTRNYNFTNRNVVVTGWGATEKGRSSPDLLKAEIPMVSFEKCKKTYENVAEINHRQLCAGGSTKSDSCAGDSGGPLHAVASLYNDQRLIQQGIVSFGPRDCGQNGLPGVYTKVAYYMDWILDVLKP